VMRQRLFIGRWLTVMSGDDLRKRIGAAKGRTLNTQKVVAIVLRRSFVERLESSSSGA